MAKRRHANKRPVVPCADANQRAIESIKERERIAEARRKKMEEMRARYLEEVKKREDEKKKAEELPTINPPTITQQESAGAAGE